MRVGTIDPRTVRFVTHKDVDDDDITRVDRRARRAAGRLTWSTTDVPTRVLAIYAHPDDPEISAGGTLARWADAGADVHVLITTRGDKGSDDPDVDPDALDAARASRRPRPRHACSA